MRGRTSSIWRTRKGLALRQLLGARFAVAAAAQRKRVGDISGRIDGLRLRARAERAHIASTAGQRGRRRLYSVLLARRLAATISRLRCSRRQERSACGFRAQAAGAAVGDGAIRASRARQRGRTAAAGSRAAGGGAGHGGRWADQRGPRQVTGAGSASAPLPEPVPPPPPAATCARPMPASSATCVQSRAPWSSGSRRSLITTASSRVPRAAG